MEVHSVSLGVVRGDTPAQLVAAATHAADALKAVIQAKTLYSKINGREYVRVEGWMTLATMMGFLPREVSVTRDERGTYTATVELVRIADGAVLTRASAECGMDEATWKTRADYARRSMAATRATSKACRLAFSWVMVLAGYEATPSEEIPTDDGEGAVTRKGAKDQPKPKPAPPPQDAKPHPPLNEMPPALAKPDADPLAPESKLWTRKDGKAVRLGDMTSEELLMSRAWIVKTHRMEEYLQPIDDVLAGRQGE